MLYISIITHIFAKVNIIHIILIKRHNIYLKPVFKPIRGNLLKMA